MLRPATPLSVLFFVAFVLLLLSSISTPLVKTFALASNDGYTFGVWGFCKGEECSPIGIGYHLDDITPTGGSFTVDVDRRHSVSYILIVHPIAAFLTLVCFSLAVAAHFHSPAHSPRFLLALFLLTIPTLLVSMLAFLVDVLLFIPHLQWGGWVVLAATIIIVVCSLVTCGMRRTLVSRKAHRKRIQENAEMSGENYFARKAVQEATLPRAESPPPLSGSVSPHTEKMMGYSSFGLRPNPGMDDRTPLNPSTLSFRTAPSVRSDRGGYGNGRPVGIVGRPSRDQFGNLIPGDDYMGPDSALVPPPLRPKGSNGSLGSHGSGRSMGPPGLYPRGRNGQGRPRGGYQPRGGPMRGGPGGMRGPPPGWANSERGRGGMMGPGPGGRGGAMMGRPGGSPDYDENVPYGRSPDGRYRSPGPFNGPPTSASPSPPLPMGNGSPVDNQLNYRAISPPSNLDRRSPSDLPLSDQAYVPPRSQWASKPSAPVPLGQRALSPIQASPTEHSTPRSDPLDRYIEDVDPRFAESSPSRSRAQPAPSALPPSVPSSNSLPASLATYQGPSNSRTPPPQGPPPVDNNRHGLLRPPPLDHERYASYDSLPLAEGQRSPAGSDASHFTSISQRGVNPNWRPPPGSNGPGSQNGRPRAATHDDLNLNANPDFSLPTGKRGRGGYRGRGSGRSGRGGASGLPASGLGGGGPYPSASNGSLVGSRYPTP